jgi:hypothetical protein
MSADHSKNQNEIQQGVEPLNPAVMQFLTIIAEAQRTLGANFSTTAILLFVLNRMDILNTCMSNEDRKKYLELGQNLSEVEDLYSVTVESLKQLQSAHARALAAAEKVAEGHLPEQGQAQQTITQTKYSSYIQEAEKIEEVLAIYFASLLKKWIEQTDVLISKLSRNKTLNRAEIDYLRDSNQNKRDQLEKFLNRLGGIHVNQVASGVLEKPLDYYKNQLREIMNKAGMEVEESFRPATPAVSPRQVALQHQGPQQGG